MSFFSYEMGSKRGIKKWGFIFTLRIEDYNCFKDYIHLHINDCIDHCRHKNIMHLPTYHGCDTVNRNGTRKLIDYRRGSYCFYPTDKGYWRKTKAKYRITYVYFTRYMSQYGLQSLVKIKGKSLYSYRLEKFVPREEVLKYFHNRHPGLDGS